MEVKLGLSSSKNDDDNNNMEVREHNFYTNMVMQNTIFKSMEMAIGCGTQIKRG